MSGAPGTEMVSRAAGAAGPVTLVLGGARSGKSEVAEQITAALPPPVTYVATIVVGDDGDLERRVAEHRARRPVSWATVEVEMDLADTLERVDGTVVVDSLGPWVAAHHGTAVDAAGLLAALEGRRGATVIVSEDVGGGVHPETATGRWFRDELGRVNQLVADAADAVLLVVAGRVLALPRWPGAAGC